MPSEREQAIRERVAYAIWEEEGRPDGKALDHWQRAILRTQYLGTLGFYDGSEATAKRLAAAFTRAHDLRKFEIEHYWKRSTYFWAFQVAIFAAFGLLWKETGTKPGTNPVLVVLAGLGILTALANALSARGSRFWQNNWEKHIDVLEDQIEGRLYKSVWVSDGKVSFSVSRVNQYLSDYFVIFWVFITFYVVCIFVGSSQVDFFYGHHSRRLIYVLIIVGVIVLGIVFLFGQTSGSRATLPKPDGSHGADQIKREWHCPHWRWPDLRKRIREAGGADSQTFIRRYAPDEP